MTVVERNAIVEELVSRTILTRETADEVYQRASRDGRSAAAVVVEDRLVDEDTVFRVVADAAGMRFLQPDDVYPDPKAIGLLPAEWARRLHALPYGFEGSQLLVAVDEPANVTVADDLRRLTKIESILVLAPTTALMRAISAAYRAEEAAGIDALSSETADSTVLVVDEDQTSGASGTEDTAPVVRFVNALITEAVAARASDIHLEPTGGDLRVRFRIDGVLQSQRSRPRNLLNPVVSRIKIMANMDIAERRVPQDGRMTVNVDGRKIDLRVVTIPTVYGEKVVLRVLDTSMALMNLDDIGMASEHQEIYNHYYRRPHGMVLVTGPTGSGKSTTLYATVNQLRGANTNIITVEDPVEARIDNINQMQVNLRAGLTFAAALRSILRADPDTILIGEIRDLDTAAIAVEAALTGHMVLSTLHTNNAATAVTRLTEMGIAPYLVGTAVDLVVAQRLMRRLCDRCAVKFTVSVDDLHAAELPWESDKEPPILRRAVGCDFCNQTGYRGRVAIHEMLEVTPALKVMINRGAQAAEIEAAAREERGMISVREDGWQKVLAGVSTIEELLRVTA